MSEEERETPIWRNVILWTAFALLVVVAVFTVLIPELTSDDEEGEETSEAPQNPENDS